MKMDGNRDKRIRCNQTREIQESVMNNQRFVQILLLLILIPLLSGCADTFYKWRYPVGNEEKGTRKTRHRPAVGPGGNTLVATTHSLLSISREGDLNWNRTLKHLGKEEVITDVLYSPIGKFVVSTTGSPAILFLDEDGYTDIKTRVGEPVRTLSVNSRGGLLAITDDANLVSITPDGTVRWKKSLHEYGQASPVSKPVVGAEESIYTVLTKVSGRRSGSFLVATDRNGNQKWVKSLEDIPLSAPSIGPDGRIYAGSHTKPILFSFRRDGSVAWKKNFDGARAIPSPPSFTESGMICTGLRFGTLAILKQNGTIVWQQEMKSIQSVAHGTRTTPAVDQSGFIHITTSDGNYLVYSPRRNLERIYKATSSRRKQSAVSPPVITRSGTVLMLTDEYLYAFPGDNPPASSSWPMDGKTPENSWQSPFAGR